MKYLLYCICGFAGGILGGMGMGGGTLLIPLLTLLCGVKQHVAQAVNLVAFLPMSAAALFVHIKNGLVDKDGLTYMILPGIAFAAAFSYIAKNIPGVSLGRYFGGFLIALSVVEAALSVRAIIAKKANKA